MLEDPGDAAVEVDVVEGQDVVAGEDVAGLELFAEGGEVGDFLVDIGGHGLGDGDVVPVGWGGGDVEVEVFGVEVLFGVDVEVEAGVADDVDGDVVASFLVLGSFDVVDHDAEGFGLALGVEDPGFSLGGEVGEGTLLVGNVVFGGGEVLVEEEVVADFGDEVGFLGVDAEDVAFFGEVAEAAVGFDGADVGDFAEFGVGIALGGPGFVQGGACFVGVAVWGEGEEVGVVEVAQWRGGFVLVVEGVG